MLKKPFALYSILFASLLLTLLPIIPWWLRTTTQDPENIIHLITPLISIIFIFARRKKIGLPQEFLPDKSRDLIFIFPAMLVLILFSSTHYFLVAGLTWILFLLMLCKYVWNKMAFQALIFPICFLIFSLPWSEFINKAF